MRLVIQRIPGLVVDDLRRTRVLAASWLALVAVEVGFMASPWSASAAALVGYAMLGFELVRYLGIVVVATRVVQRDPACDPQAPWRQTTPPLTLWLGKVASTLLLGAIAPAVLLALGLGLAGVAAWGALHRAAELAADHAVVVSAAWLVAVPTRTGFQAFAAAVVALTAWIGSVYVTDEMLPHRVDLWMRPSLEVAMASAVAASMAITAWLYVTRRRAIAVAAAALCAAVGMVVSTFGASAFIAALNADPPELPGDVATVTMQAPGAWREEWPGSRSVRFSAVVRASSPRADRYFELADVSALLEAPSGLMTEEAHIERARPVSRPASADEAPYASMRTELGVSTLILPPEAQAAEDRVVVQAPDAIRAAVQAQGGRLAAYVDLLEHRLDTSLRLAPIAGAQAALGASRVVVTEVSRSGADVTITLHWLGSTGGVLPVLVSGGGQKALLGTSDLGGGIFVHGFRAARMRGWKLHLTASGERVTFSNPEGAGIADPTMVLVDDVLIGKWRSALIEVDGIGRVP